ncbi:hypothetical protein ACOACO_18460 [Nocardioides sp. CPCC 205120]|uniref:hypothetical protein n=1 Tax=Nocardioides sp. CPCC 205120 TaxID=3406462 RepID=UPI003B50DB6D
MPERPESTTDETETRSPVAEVLDVTPQMARDWLARNPSNRSVRRHLVESYARDMRAGRWALNGETVKIAADGNLLDGQHRLSAVVLADRIIPMVVVREVSADHMPTIDTGAKRTYADALKVLGEENTSVLAAVSRRALLWHRGHRTRWGSLHATALELNEFIAEHPQIRNSADVATKLASKALLPASTFGLAHWLLSAIDPDDAMWFLARVADGDALPTNHPVAALRDRIVRMRVGGGRINETDAIALLILAWNAYRAGGTRTKLQLPKGGLTNENFPMPR